ncbi:cytidine deaminase [Pseudoalteromonas sp. CNC9-20]|uniref:cytidine deaminase n=1 Tax=Pseudoalteromonas sp. CNC9-20 TaxID=2917750 RepID=UPI001EF65C6D|nr:cytidine deaminase [Pseudoalteromonas sp. CNC9-20]MCG7569369.1 cytidine deaminase [Pseudoalteromonas sp. CNC9-20]
MQVTGLLAETKRQGGIASEQQFKELQQELGSSFKDTIDWLLAQTQTWAVAPISSFHVAALVKARNSQGDVFYAVGVNVELAGLGLEVSTHAEQCALHNAWLHGATEIEHIYISAAPCGHCRQFINEFKDAKNIAITIGDKSTTLNELLPQAFGPVDLGVEQPLLGNSASYHDDSRSLHHHFAQSYAPYSGGKAAVAIEYEGATYFGRYMENAAFNPSFSPMQAALSQIVLANQEVDFSAITAVTLLEQQAGKSHLGASKTVLAQLAPHAQFNYELLSSSCAPAIT